MKGYIINMLGNKLEYIIIGGLATTTFLSGLVLSSLKVSADDSVIDDVSITVPVSCTMSGTGMNTHNAEITNGTYQADIGTTTLHAFCNDSNGFAIYAAGYTGDEIGGTNSNKLVGASTNNTIETGLATAPGNPDVSNWAMKLAITQDSGDTTGTNAFSIDSAPNTSGGADASFSQYHVVPNEYVRVAHKNSGTDMTAVTGGVKLTTTYATYISRTQPADTYTGQVIYTLVHPANSDTPLHPIITEAGKICYYPNGGNVLGTMGCQTIGVTDGTTSTSATLLASNFSRQGYGFAGWNTEYDYSGTFYGPQEDISFIEGQYSGDNDGLSLYAVWVKPVGSFQDSTKVAQLCGTGQGSLTTAPTDGTANLSSVSALTDERDNEIYAIAKLADGNCWMIENLRLADIHQESGNTVATTLTTINTNNPLNDGDQNNPTVTLKHNYTDASTFTNLSSTSNVAYDADTAPNGWCTTSTAACNDQSRLNTDNTINRDTEVPNINTGSIYSYGNYYNWYSATAGNGTYGTNSNSAGGDLCPAGWRLPYGNGRTSGGFYYLNYKINNNINIQDSDASKKLRAYPNNYLYSGYVNSGSLNNRGIDGYYWSSTVNTYYKGAYHLVFYSSGVRPGDSVLRGHYGASVRCLASSQAI